MKLPSIKQASIELRRLQIIWHVCRYSFDYTKKSLVDQIKKKNVDPATPVVWKEDEIASNYYVLFHRVDSQGPRYVRETLFVRLISTLEVLLIDAIRDIFIARTDLFLRQSKSIQFSYGEVLSANSISDIRNRIVLRETRSLHSKGIRETAKYYERSLDIRFSEIIPNLNELWEMVDRRHLLVHQLGKADAAYRHKYAYVAKALLTVNDAYLNRAFKLMSQFVERLDQKIGSLVTDSPDADEVRDHLSAELEIETASTDGDDLLRSGYTFIVNDPRTGERGAKLDDILINRRKADTGTSILLISGDRKTVEVYLGNLRKAQKKGFLSVVRQVGIREKRVRPQQPTRLDGPTVEAIARLLPHRPWPEGIHKIIAERLQVKNSECWRAIGEISENPKLLGLAGVPATE